tara:strand:+ start:19304 stop:19666 length:363 start_codon:yes stop_codon:yes gene_type:complete
MKTIALTLAAATISAPVFAGPYVNVETNATYSGSDYQSRATDVHLGYENTLGALDWYVQGGKTINSVDGADSDSNYSGKFGGSVAATKRLGIYGEVSFANIFDKDTTNTYGTQLGAKFSF